MSSFTTPQLSLETPQQQWDRDFRAALTGLLSHAHRYEQPVQAAAAIADKAATYRRENDRDPISRLAIKKKRTSKKQKKAKKRAR